MLMCKGCVWKGGGREGGRARGKGGGREREGETGDREMALWGRDVASLGTCFLCKTLIEAEPKARRRKVRGRRWPDCIQMIKAY